MSPTIRTLIALAIIPASGGARPLATLISQADAIVLGTESTATQAGNTVTFLLNVERVFTGGIAQGSTVSVVWNTRSIVGMPDNSPTYRGIWFLRKGSGNSWDCIPAATTGNGEFFPDLSLPVTAGTPPAQLAYNAGTTALADQLVLETAGAHPRNPNTILDIASGMKSPAALQALRYMAASQTNGEMLAGIAGLIQAGDTAGLVAAEGVSSTLTVGTPGADRIASALQLYFRSSDPVAVAALGRMATDGKAAPAIQAAAAQALAAIHTAAAVPALGLLLNSASPQMQAYGAQGLSYFVNGVGIPSAQTMAGLDHLNHRDPSPYRTAETEQHIGYKVGQPQPFVDFWKTWWQQHPELRVALAP